MKLTAREKRKQMADRYLRAVTKAHRANVREYSGPQDDLTMIRMFDDDLALHKKAISAIRKNELGAVNRIVWGELDTEPRDNIPASVINWLDKELAK